MSMGQPESAKNFSSLRMGPAFACLMEQAYPRLKAYLGELKFVTLADAYLAAKPSAIPNVSLYWDGFAAFIASPESPFRQHELMEFALLENALRRAQELESPPTKPGPEVYRLHPSAQILNIERNTLSLWSALVAGEKPPAPEILRDPLHVLVWRQGADARFRILGADEWLALTHMDSMKPGLFLSGWLESGLIV